MTRYRPNTEGVRLLFGLFNRRLKTHLPSVQIVTSIARIYNPVLRVVDRCHVVALIVLLRHKEVVISKPRVIHTTDGLLDRMPGPVAGCDS